MIIWLLKIILDFNNLINFSKVNKFESYSFIYMNFYKHFKGVTFTFSICMLIE